jgi:hypothetical protein
MRGTEGGSEHSRPWVALIAIAATGFVLAFTAAQPYPGVTVDSGEYLAVADGLASGHGYTMPYASYDEAFRVLEEGERVPMTQFPPLYPTLLALLHVAGLSLLSAARLIGAFTYAAMLLIACGLVWRYSARTWVVWLTGALLLAPELLTLHAMAWTEPLMVVATLAALHFTVRYVREGGVSQLVLAGACGATASLSRFAGISVILATGAAILLVHAWSLRRRLLRAVVFVGCSSIPVALWFARNAAISGAASEKEPAWHPPTFRHLRQAAETIGGWVEPYFPAASLVGAIVAGIALVAAVLLLPRLIRRGAASLPSACLLFALVYLFFLLLSRSVLDQNIPFDTRLLSPVQVLVVVGLCAALALSSPSTGRRWGVYALTALASIAVVRAVSTTIGFSGSPVAAYSGDDWRASETLAYAGSLPEDTIIITNAPDPIWLWHGRAPLIIPPRSSLYSGKPNENYAGEVDEVLERTACEEAFVIFFKQPTRKPPRTLDPIVVAHLRLTEVTPFEDGRALEVDEPGRPCG